MARKTVTTYACDSCGKTVDRAKDLRPFTLDQRARYYEEKVKTDLCDECEDTFLTDISRFFADDKQDQLVAMRRKEAK